MYNLMLRLAILIGFTLYIFACSKITDDLSGNEIMSGKARIQNLWEGEKDIPFSNDSVYIKKPSDSTSNDFMYGTKTDAFSSFIFTNLNKDADYTISAKIFKSTRLDTSILFTGRVQTNASNLPLQLLIQPDTLTQNGLYIVCTDIFGGALPEDSIYIYTSSQLASNDAAAVTGAGNSYHFITKIDGTALKMKLSAGVKLYILAAKTFGNLRLKSQLINKQLRVSEIDTVDIQMQ